MENEYENENPQSIIERALSFFETTNTFSLVSAMITTTASILFFTFIYNHPELDMWENRGGDFFVMFFKIIMILSPIFACLQAFFKSRLVDMCNGNMFETVGRLYQQNFEAVSNGLYRVHKIQEASLERVKEYNQELLVIEEKLRCIENLRNDADDCIEKIQKILKDSIEVVKVLKQDNLVHEAYVFIKTGTREFQQFYNMIKSQKESVEGIFTNKTNSLDKDFSALQKSIKNCSNDIKFIEGKLKSVIADSETLNRVL